MTSLPRQFLSIGAAQNQRNIAYIQRPGRSPGLFWLNGFRSVMTGIKASTLDAFGAEQGLEVTRFDYSGYGESGGDFDEATITRWLEETIAVFSQTHGPQIVVGSSMGGWLALLLARHLLKTSQKRLQGLILIAPAVDATHDLIPTRFTPEQLATLAERGFVERVSKYGDGDYRYTKALLDDGENHLLFGRVIETGCPVHILQGGRDPDVPPAHAQKLLTHILHDPVTFTLIPDGDHRLSREEDLERLRQAVLGMM
ncbi:alpha/beta hydrolase [Devosia riboflavina]|uniref:Palmitoyl-protein thioesterase ABHD10, mitochondrial n=1 Tax=Devosia riboflavina TaxID=46914 RepID=A0A087M681_9HYPH|nr:alpha/beta hydrolase [Devosia riboflavina]KFL32384.1 alpha/beta hydrolase [Devosia riboflavina]